jgi:hypothetical protein
MLEVGLKSQWRANFLVPQVGPCRFAPRYQGTVAASGGCHMNPRIVMAVAAVLLSGSGDLGFAQSGGGTGTPGGPPTGGAAGPGTAPAGVGGRAPVPGIGVGGSAPTAPGVGVGGSAQTLGGKSAAPKIGETKDADIKAEYLEAVPYQPCPANVRFPNGQQMCLGLPGDPFYRPYRPPSNE